jgi:hypothetical protein
MSYSSAKRRRIKPYARATSFDINVAFDIRHYQQIRYGKLGSDPMFPSSGTPEAFKVLEGEILMQATAPGVRRYGDHQCHVFSFANGLKAKEKTKWSIMKMIKYSGVAVTEFTPDVDVFEQGFVMTMGGLNTLFNNGSSTLYPGDLICADIPNPLNVDGVRQRALQTGIPHDKFQFVITPYRDLKTELSSLRSNNEETSGEELASQFIMGTALSYSAPGAPVDVVLHKCNVICQKEVVAAVGGTSGSDYAFTVGKSGTGSAAPRPKKPKRPKTGSNENK